MKVINKVNQQLLDWIELWAFFGTTLCRYAKQESIGVRDGMSATCIQFVLNELCRVAILLA